MKIFINYEVQYIFEKIVTFYLFERFQPKMDGELPERLG
jgi:hypothetical protein